METFANDENLTYSEKKYNELLDLIIDNNIATKDEL